MKYTQEAYQAAYSELDRRRQNALSGNSRNVSIIENEYPEIYKIYHEITQTADKLSAAVFSKSSSPEEIRAAVNKIREDNLAAQYKLERTLEAFGFPCDYLAVKYTCPLCKDTGSVNGKRCKCVDDLLNKFTIEKLNEQCKITLHNFSEFRLDYYPETVTYGDQIINCKNKMSENLKLCMEYAKSFAEHSQGLFMFGSTGLGKTFLSSCIASELLNKGYSVAFDSVLNYLRAIEKEHFGKSDGDTLEILLNADLVILDDLGCEFSSSFNSASIYNILNSRSNMSRPTIVSTNLSIKELSQRYDERIVSRLMGGLQPVRFIGKDIRQIKMMNGDY